MSIIIFADLFTFPDGSAATNRVYTYAKGFTENGIKVHVICFSYSNKDEASGSVDGIKFYHPFSSSKTINGRISKYRQKFVRFFETYKIVKAIKKEDKIIAINCWSNFLPTQLFAKFLSLASNAKLVVETSEHPFRYYENNFLKKIQGRIKFFIESGIADGILCISHFLVDFYKKKGVAEKKLFLVPSTVDPSRFNQLYVKPVEYSYIGYFGSLTFGRDHVDVLIKAFTPFSSQQPDAHLIIGGFCTNGEKKQIMDLIYEQNMQSNVHLLEYLSREEILQYIINAHILVMVRNNDIYTQASYPSKLTEFLATSIPVISANVGEIPLYLTDSKDAFLFEPGNINALSEKISYVWNNYELAKAVGENGKRLTETIFNYKYQAKRMIGFINSIT